MQVGNTPLANLEGVLAKLERHNPQGSIKARMVQYIIDRSEEMGLLRPGMQIFEATSGNTGIHTAAYGTAKGYDVSIILPEGLGVEREERIRRYGADLILCDQGDFAQAAMIRDALVESNPDHFSLNQFENDLNWQCHYRTTGQEIIRQAHAYSPKPIDAFVAGVGTGGTLRGVATALREVYPSVRIVAVEPAESAVMSGGPPGLHGIPGIGDGFIPGLVLDGCGLIELIDDVFSVSSDDAKRMAMRVERESGICAGISAGACLEIAQYLSQHYENVVTVVPDGCEKYHSMGLQHNPLAE